MTVQKQIASSACMINNCEMFIMLMQDHTMLNILSCFDWRASGRAGEASCASVEIVLVQGFNFEIFPSSWRHKS